jgi:hypothetical protein
VNILQARILEAGKKRTDTRPRSFFICLKWSHDNQSGEISDSSGFSFGVISDDLAPECEGYLNPSERVSGVVDGPYVSNILIESGERAIGNIPAEREEFESQGATDRTGAWQPRGTPHRIAGTPDSGRFSHPQLHEKKL